MKAESVHTLIVGAGPAGLAAGYTLARAGLKPIIIERDKSSGGLMRSIHHGEFIVDVGRKELYNRLSKVDGFWSDLLGEDYRSYVHRGGLLYDGHIIDMSPAYRGVRRGMPWAMFAHCAVDFLWARVRPGVRTPRNLQEYWYRQRGKLLTQITNQGFQEKLSCTKWAEIPLSDEGAVAGGERLLGTLWQGLRRTFSRSETNTHRGIWRHPARGTGQICETLEQGITRAGGRICHQAQILDIGHAHQRLKSVTVLVNSQPVLFSPANVISCAPAEFLHRFLLKSKSEGDPGRPPPHRQKVVLLVYLFADGEPRFPHFWLQVTCPKTRIGRITNYSALDTDMVPKGKTCLCCEFYCEENDPLLTTDDKQLVELALSDCSRSSLIDRHTCFDSLVLRFPGADASQNRHNWLDPRRKRLLAELSQFSNLYPVNRTDLDIATLAGLEAAEAILSGDRTQFDLHVDPATLGIRSESKPFEFRLPEGVLR